MDSSIIAIIVSFIFGAGGIQIISMLTSKKKTAADVASTYQEILQKQASMLAAQVESNNQLIMEVGQLKAKISDLEIQLAKVYDKKNKEGKKHD